MILLKKKYSLRISFAIIIMLAISIWGLSKSISDGEIFPINGIVEAKETFVSESNENCLMCHADPDFKGYFEDGTSISLFVSIGEYQRSVHEPAGLECVACHTEISTYPHHEEQITCQECHIDEEGNPDDYVALRVELQYNDHREMSLALNDACRSCHEEEFGIAVDSAHMKALNSGNRDAPICIDCHGSHDISTPDQPREKISLTCSNCHRAVYSTYRSSIHGEALASNSNPDVPTCVDCHGVHEVRGPRDMTFRNDSITICGECHGDKDLMAKYEISPNVFETYLSDFHGRSVDQFRRWGNDNPSNKATCFDCHGIHNIRSSDDPVSMVYPENLQHTCQQCHTDASIRFPEAWLSHYIPSEDDMPILYWIDIIYQGLIAVTIGGFLLYISLDVVRRQIDKRRLVRALRNEETEDDFDFF